MTHLLAEHKRASNFTQPFAPADVLRPAAFARG
jgi:hypothetical protein